MQRRLRPRKQPCLKSRSNSRPRVNVPSKSTKLKCRLSRNKMSSSQQTWHGCSNWVSLAQAQTNLKKKGSKVNFKRQSDRSWVCKKRTDSSRLKSRWVNLRSPRYRGRRRRRSKTCFSRSKKNGCGLSLSYQKRWMLFWLPNRKQIRSMRIN